MLYFNLLSIVVPSLCNGNLIGIAESITEIFPEKNFDLGVYHPFNEIIAYLHSLQRRYPRLVQVQQIGTTVENNPIEGLKIGKSDIGTQKPAIWIDSCIHASEWVAAATSLYIIDHLVKGYDTNDEIRQLVDAYEWYIFPVLNPDGYNYTWSTDRLWQKNRSYNVFNKSISECRGTNLNRNFDIDFEGLRNSSTDPCSDYYRGKAAFSEPESRAVRDAVLHMGDRLKLCISLHSYGQIWMSPLAYSQEFPPNYKDLLKAMKVAVSTIKNFSGENYTLGTISHVVGYLSSSSFTDWVYEKADVKYSFVVELRDTGKYGRLLPSDYILPTAKENCEAIKAVVETISN